MGGQWSPHYNRILDHVPWLGANEALVGSARRWPEVEIDKVEVTRTSRPPLVVLGHTASLWPVKTLLWAEDLLTLCQQTKNICTGTRHPHIFVF